MLEIFINQKTELINVISNKGLQLNVDAETLARWNNAISDWWKVQLEIDKYLKEQNDN